MLKIEYLTIRNKNFKKFFSDKSFYIKRTDSEVLFEDAIELEDSLAEYIETDQVIVREEGEIHD